ncbi:MAG TPA: peroxidase [Planctomycetota bacterium]|nr:peroxidase [Planctomycetota bacterium]
MDPMFLRDVESAAPKGPHAEIIARLEAGGQPVSQLLRMFAFKPDRTRFLAQFTQGVMRGPSPLTPAQREMIAAFTSQRNRCPF